MSWIANNKYFLTGSITSGLTLSKNNADAGTVPTDMSISTYSDYNYSASNYEITAIFEGTFESSFTSNDISWTSVGDSNDIKYQLNESSDGISFDGWSGESNAIGITAISANKQYFKLRLIFYSSYWTDSDSMQIDSIKLKFTVFVNAGIIDANDWNANYQVVGSESLLPREGASMLATNSSVDLGSASFAWNNTYINTLHIAGELGGTLNQIARTTLSVAAQKIEFSSLTDTQFFIKCKFVFDTVTSDDTLLFFNGDSASSYGYQRLVGTLGSKFVTQSGILLTPGGSVAVAYVGCFDGWIQAEAAKEKMIIGRGFSGAGGTAIEEMYMLGGLYNETSNTVTSIQIYNNSKFEPNTEVTLWAKK